MKILNLVYPEKSDIEFKINNYPDGQRDIVIDKECCYESAYGYLLMTHKDCKVTIKSRLNNMEDLGLIICATQALRNLGVKEIHLYVPYIMGLRSDRLFQEGGVRYIKDILAPLINSQNFESVTCYDAHSYVAENCINNLHIIDNFGLIKWSLGKIYEKSIPEIGATTDDVVDNFILVSPDDGASKKIYKVAEKIGYKGDIIVCSKSRDTDGKLTKTVVPINDLLKNTINNELNKDFIIIDDIADGSGTFINIAKEIKEKSKHFKIGKLYLVVTHGIFSKGFAELNQYFDGIYCTNSYSDLRQDQFIGTKYDHDKVKQLNVF